MSSTMLNVNTVKVELNPENLEACRICLAWSGKLYSIQEWGLDTMFVELMGTTLSVWDGFPQHVCVVCRALLLKAHALRARCRRADALLKQALMHQHFITNNFIRSVDRSAHNLNHALSSEGGKVAVTSYHYEDSDVTNPFTPPIPLQPPLDFVALIDNNIRTDEETEESDIKYELNCDDIDDKIDDFHDSSPDTDKQVSLENVIAEANVDMLKNKTNIEAFEVNKGLEQQMTAVKWKKKRRGKNTKPDVKIFKNKREKAKKNCQFSREEDFKEFEKKYNFQVQILTDEEMAKEMEKRKESNKYIKGTYKCNLCYNGFLTSSIYDNHMKTHDPGRGEQECSFCHVRFNFPVKLRQHVENAHRLKFRCSACNEVVRGKPSAELHAAYHAGTTFKCAHCDKQFLKKTSRTSHMRASHPVENAAGGTCELCGETFTSRTGLRSHKTRSHKKPSLPALRCRKCGVQFDNMEAIKRHRETRPDNKCDASLSACEQCGDTCASADALMLHRHQHHNVELFTCDTCTKSFTSKASLATHIDRIHRSIRPPKADYSDGGRRQQGWLHWASVCEHCGKRLSCRATLKIHMNKHTGERPYKCTLCPKAYMTPYGLNNHQAFHTGVRKWQCPDCPATFMHQSSVYVHRKCRATLKIHMNKHTGERPYKCTLCPKAYMTPYGLNNHQAFHTGVRKWQCPDCPATFMHQSSVYVHRKIHTGERPHQCTICDKYFTQSGSLYTHVKYVHMKETPPPRKRNKKPAAT